MKLEYWECAICLYVDVVERFVPKTEKGKSLPLKWCPECLSTQLRFKEVVVLWEGEFPPTEQQMRQLFIEAQQVKENMRQKK